MPVRPLRRSASCLYGTDAPHRRGARRHCHHGLDGAGAGARALRLRPPRRPAPGATFASTLSIHPATSISRPKSSARCACSTARSRCLTRCTVCSRSRKKSGGRPISTASREFALSTRSTRWVPISSMPSIPSASASVPSPSRFNFPSARKTSSEASST